MRESNPTARLCADVADSRVDLRTGHDLDAPGLWPTLRGWLAASATDATATAVARDADDAKLWSDCACFRDFDAFAKVIDAAEARLSRGEDLDASLVFAHNDLTLDNVMVGPDGTVRLVDLERVPVSLSFSMDTTRNKAGSSGDARKVGLETGGR